ncbi:MAG TPA: 2-hydroxyacyl-CoA dehydratase [Candidatus Lachnoclostridium pullistercoris]|uniref:2-hydroxyacyl-CoA dehydratase n=1 Tax=Candidatus Lachnoclostridium pullistercoris TaxID=2838632 RepID=A0A9D2PED4_9FIRM|nr:2-hydroxyacyl-CoA dehydratase [Candidatus Lachnoclostridium pullistercoris]
MLGYICKYAPVEIFESMGVDMERIEPEVTNFSQADMRMHPNVCSFAKGVLEDVLSKDYEGVILTTCCDSIRRLYDVLKAQLPDRFIYMLDTPRITKDAGIRLYEERIREMVATYEAFSGKTFDEGRFLQLLREKKAQSSEESAQEKGGLSVGIAGARANKNIKKILEERGVRVAFDLTCTGLTRKLLIEEDQVMTGYVRGLLSQFPCMRMEAAAGRDQLILKYGESADGIIYHTVQFCDNYSYEYAWLKGIIRRPLLLLETDYTKQSYGQILTRIEAFLESLGQNPKLTNKKTGGNDAMYVMGIDSGSTSTNAVIMDRNREIQAFSVVRTGAKSGQSAQKILEEVLDKAGLKREDISWIVSTGYGRVSIPFADENVTEISCHGRGAHYFNPKVRTILDIGGQDSKAIHLNEAGEVTDFVMNDKCAAGTGRFLEMIARSLEMDISELGPAALQSTEYIEITSMCSVFAESEVISLIAQNKEKADIAAGVCRSIAGKSYSLMKRVGLEPEFMMTGGVAKNPGVARAVEEKIGAKLYICPEPEIVGAVGAALYALDQIK